MRSKAMSNLPPTVTDGLITCIGNKRRLLEPLGELFSPLLRTRSPGTFLDPFCGSGGVARLARHIGFTVTANDWEPYAWTATAPYLENGAGEIDLLFAAFGGVDAFFDEINRRRTPREPYIARHYAPQRTDQPRTGRERLFYTAENALAIDAAREAIDELLPPESPDGDAPSTDARSRARRAALAPLLYAASVHANTSGVFKAYHKGFGGLGRDALSRILRPIRLAPPRVPRGAVGSAHCEDATRFVSARGADLCYLDPPYSGHQYGSNYFMLNTITRWSRAPVDERRDTDGNLMAKAGIPPEWVATRSEFCSRPRAVGAMRALLDAIDARHIVVSYSSDGIIGEEELAELLATHGELTIRTLDYATYRGGRQSIQRRRRNSELIFVVDRRPSRRSVVDAPRAVPLEALRALAVSRLSALGSRRFHPGRLAARFGPGCAERCPETIELGAGWHATPIDPLGIAIPLPPDELSVDEITTVIEALEQSVVDDHAEALDLLVRLVWEEGMNARRHAAITGCLRSFAHRPYRNQFSAAVALIGRAMLLRPARFASLHPALSGLVARARMRFGFPRCG